VGVALSWLAVRGKSAESVLTDSGFAPPASRRVSEVAGHLFTAAGCMVRSHHSRPCGCPRRNARSCASFESAEAVTCFVEEHVMFSSASTWIDGQRAWCVTHESERGPRHLAVVGDAPSHLKELSSGGLPNRTGKLKLRSTSSFEVPVDLASARRIPLRSSSIDGVALNSTSWTASECTARRRQLVQSISAGERATAYTQCWRWRCIVTRMIVHAGYRASQETGPFRHGPHSRPHSLPGRPLAASITYGRFIIPPDCLGER